MRTCLCHGMRPVLLSTALWFSVVFPASIFSSAQNAAPPIVDGEQIRRLNERIAAQDEQLAAQQEQIHALQSGLAEQRALIDRMMHASDLALANQPPDEAAIRLSEQAAVLSHAHPPAVMRQEPVKPIQEPTMTPQQAAAFKSEQKEEPFPKPAKQWFNKYSIRGYMQFRESNIANTNTNYTCDQCDKGFGANDKFFLRRMRLVISGNVTDRISVYLQPDFASSTSDTNNIAQIRDAYFDGAIDAKKANRIRVGLSKVPYGFENLQSSQNRLDFDRDDAINSCCSNERDIGVTYYWAPPYIRERFAELVSSGLKGSGDYGEFGFAIVNGETLNITSNNTYFHYFSRYTYPFKLRNGQFIEASVQGYYGKFTVPKLSSSTITQPNALYNDGRGALSLIIYPQPWGFQTEWNWGTGPEYDPANKTIEQKQLNGGYALLNYRFRPYHGIIFHPYSRLTYYDGGKKFETDARKYRVIEGDAGLEMQFGKAFEFTPQYTGGYRLFEDGGKPNNEQRGNLFRVQLQYNY